MPITSPEMDAAVATATLDPWHALPSLVFAATTSSEQNMYTGASGYTHRPDWPSSPAELDAARKMTINDVHDLWSASKMICVLAALQLVEQGKVDLHGDAAQYVPELKTLKRLDGFKEDGSPNLVDVEATVTVHMMITHTMG
jgi:methyl acetate hydrolase